MRALFESTTNYNSLSTTSVLDRDTQSRGDGTFLLDFLYPPGTKSVLRRWSTSTFRKWRRQQRSWKTDTSTRRFVSAAKYGQETSSEIEHSNVEVEATSIVPLEELRSFQKVLDSVSLPIDQQDWDKCRDLFNSIPTNEKPWKDMIQLLTTSTISIKEGRLVDLVDDFPSDHNTNDAISHTIHALLSSQETTKAVELHEMALRSGLESKDTDVLLMHLLSRRKWPLFIKVWKDKLQYRNWTINSDAIREWERGFLEQLTGVPRRDRNIVHLSRYIHRNSLSYEDNPSVRRILKSLTRLFFEDREVSHGRHSLEIMWILRQHQMDDPYLYVQCCLTICSHEAVGSQEQGNILRKHYENFRKHQSFGPDQPLLRRILQVAININQNPLVDMVVDDFKAYLGPLPPAVAITCMRWYARQGNLATVDDMLAQCLQNHQDTSRSLLYPTLHVRAIRADPSAVQEKMEWMKKEFGYEPDQVSWGILMKAYQRTENLDGVLNTFSAMLDAGYPPEKHSLVSAMSTCADRGDVETVESLLAMASPYGFADEQSFNDILVLAVINQGRLVDAENIAKSVSATSSMAAKALQTRMWNQLVAAYAIERNLRGMHRIAKQMQTMGIKFDSITYAALMRGHAAARKTRYAHRIFHQLKSKPGTNFTSVHYAILVNGYTWEERYGDALKVHAEMLKLGIKPSLSSNLALLNLQSTAARTKPNMDNASQLLPPDAAEETFEEVLDTFDAQLFADTEVQFQTRKGPLSEVYPGAYYETLYNVYTNNGSYDLAKKLMSRYEDRVLSKNDPSATRHPIRLTTALMDLHYRQGNTPEVKRYFSLARDSALRLAGVASTSAGTDNAKANRPVPFIRKTLLARPFDLLQRSLAPLDLWSEIQTTISDLFDNGFDLDNANWNWYVQLRATHGYYISAFETCEMYLMDNFQGWLARDDIRHPKRRISAHDPGLNMMVGRDRLFRSSARFAQLKTMARLRLSLERLKRASKGESKAGEILAMISRVAPRALYAVETLPMIDHPVLTHLLSRLIDKEGNPIGNDPANNLNEQEIMDIDFEMDGARASAAMASVASKVDHVDGTSRGEGDQNKKTTAAEGYHSEEIIKVEDDQTEDIAEATTNINRPSRRRRLDERVKMASHMKRRFVKSKEAALNSTNIAGPKYFRKTFSRKHEESLHDQDEENYLEDDDEYDEDGEEHQSAEEKYREDEKSYGEDELGSEDAFEHEHEHIDADHDVER